MTNLSQTTSSDLADRLGDIRAQKADLAKQEKLIKSCLSARLGSARQKTFSGRLFDVTLIFTRRTVLDTARIRELFKATGAALPEKITTGERWDVKARKVEAA